MKATLLFSYKHSAENKDKLLNRLLCVCCERNIRSSSHCWNTQSIITLFLLSPGKFVQSKFSGNKHNWIKVQYRRPRPRSSNSCNPIRLVSCHYCLTYLANHKKCSWIFPEQFRVSFCFKQCCWGWTFESDAAKRPSQPVWNRSQKPNLLDSLSRSGSQRGEVWGNSQLYLDLTKSTKTTT